MKTLLLEISSRPSPASHNLLLGRCFLVAVETRTPAVETELSVGFKVQSWGPGVGRQIPLTSSVA